MTAITKDFLALAEGVRGKALRRVNFQAQYFKPHETESIPTNVRTEFIHRYFDAVDVEAQIADTVREAGDIHSDYSIGQLRERLELIGETLNSRWFGTSVINMVKRTQPLGSFGREAEILQGLEANPEIFGLKKTGGLLRHWLTTLGHEAPLAEVIIEARPVTDEGERFEALHATDGAPSNFGIIVPKAVIRRLN